MLQTGFLQAHASHASGEGPCWFADAHASGFCPGDSLCRDLGRFEDSVGKELGKLGDSTATQVSKVVSGTPDGLTRFILDTPLSPEGGLCLS